MENPFEYLAKRRQQEKDKRWEKKHDNEAETEKKIEPIRKVYNEYNTLVTDILSQLCNSNYEFSNIACPQIENSVEHLNLRSLSWKIYHYEVTGNSDSMFPEGHYATDVGIMLLLDNQKQPIQFIISSNGKELKCGLSRKEIINSLIKLHP